MAGVFKVITVIILSRPYLIVFLLFLPVHFEKFVFAMTKPNEYFEYSECIDWIIFDLSK